MTRSLLERLKSLSARFHALVGRSVLASWLYLRLWSLVLPLLPRGHTRERLLVELSMAAWPIERFAPVQRRLAGTKRQLKLVPHPGMIDFPALFYREFLYEPEVIAFLEGHMGEVDNVVEIGANVGIYSLYFSDCLAGRDRGRVYAFEPSPRTYRALLDNLLANDAANVTPLNAAVFTRGGLSTFYEPTVAARGDRALTRSSLVEAHARLDARQVREYPVFTLDPDYLEVLFRDAGRVLIKLDIEGAEKHVLAAMEPLLRRHRPEILMEVLHVNCEELNALAFLPQLYQLFHLTDLGPVQHDRFVGDPSYRFKDYFLSPRWH